MSTLFSLSPPPLSLLSFHSSSLFPLHLSLLSGRSWAATSTEGLLTYSLDGALVFDPYDLDLDVTPASVRRQLRQAEWATAIVLAFRLNETALTQEVLEAVPHHQSECSWAFLFPLLRSVLVCKNERLGLGGCKS